MEGQGRVAVLGGTLSGVAAAKRLAANGVSSDLFRNLNDPKRSISNVHPLCEYQSATLVVREDDPQEFVDEVASWRSAGLIEEVTDFWSGRIDAQGKVSRRALHGARFRPLGGFFSLLDALIKQLPEAVTIRAQQLVRMSWDERGGTWWLYDRHGAAYGPYAAVLFAFDALPRAARKASEKQLLESALPHTSAVIASAARAQMASSMTVVLHFDPPLRIPYDSLVFDGIPELQFAARNPKEYQQHRGLTEKFDTWTVVATPEWSLQQRPIYGGKWDKQRVGRDLVAAFGRALRCDISHCRQVVPTFHWEGCSYITKVVRGTPCAIDADVGLGWCGDMFAGIGPCGGIVSGIAAGAAFADYVSGREQVVSQLPSGADWQLRAPKDDDEDIVSLAGPCTGRREPDDGLDHTWETAVRLARGHRVQEADSYRKFRQIGALGENRPQWRNQEGPWDATRPNAAQTHSGSAAAKCALRCHRIDEGMLKLSRLPTAMQQKLLAAAFACGAQGVCGGLYNSRSGVVDIGYGDSWDISGTKKASWSEMGLHGSHMLQWEQLGGELCKEVISAIRAAAGDALQAFRPDSVRFSYENMRGRTIRQGQTLCGWSWDGDRVDDRDGSPKVLIVLGSAKRIWRSYKYTKEDRESLDVQLSPGDILVLFGEARSWVSAVTGHEPGQYDAGPFDFVHLWLQDHRRLKELRPSVYESIHCPKAPVLGSKEYKWMQYSYCVLQETSSDDGRLVELRGPDALEHVCTPVAVAEKCDGRSGGRRWRSRHVKAV